MSQDHDDDSRGLIVDDDPALDFILYKEMAKNEQKQKGGQGGCFGSIVLLFKTNRISPSLNLAYKMVRMQNLGILVSR